PATPGGPARPEADVLAAWPRTAQWTMAFLLGLSTLLIAGYSLGSLRWSTRPTRLEREAALGGPVDLNPADPGHLLQLPAAGESLAAAIEDYRRAGGGFRSVEELRNVPGIGATRLNNLRPWVYVEPEEATSPEEEPDRPAAVRGRKPPVAARPTAR